MGSGQHDAAFVHFFKHHQWIQCHASIGYSSCVALAVAVAAVAVAVAAVAVAAVAVAAQRIRAVSVGSGITVIDSLGCCNTQECVLQQQKELEKHNFHKYINISYSIYIFQKFNQ